MVSTRLAMCFDPTQLSAHQPGPNQAPLLKPLFKYVVRPFILLSKPVVVMDPDGDLLTVTVQGIWGRSPPHFSFPTP